MYYRNRSTAPAGRRPGMGLYAPAPPPSEPVQGSALEADGNHWYDFIPEIGAKIAALFGTSSHCWRGYGNRPFDEPCPGTPNYDAVARAVETAPDAQIGKLIGYLLGGNDGRGPKSRGELLQTKCIPFWVKAIMGGKGCVASKYPDAPEWFRDFVATYGAPAAGEEPGTGLPGIPDFSDPGTQANTGALLLAAALGVIVVKKLGKGPF